jgi:hypothetical protein
MSDKPWTSGPKELLDHARSHLGSRTAFDFRIAMVSIDNAVELAIRTFLGLPKRVRGGDGPSRRELEVAIGFPDLLDLLEKYDGDKLTGVELGDIEWYHRLRNTLYHDGNGVTVDPEKVDAYNQIAHVLFQNLFGTIVSPEPEPPAASLLGEFILKWAALETRVRSLAAIHLPKRTPTAHSAMSLYDGLIAKGVAPTSVRRLLEDVARTRNSVIHGTTPASPADLKRLIADVDTILNALPRE